MLLLMLKKEDKGEISNITNVATTTALTAVHNRILKVINLVKNNDCNTKICKIGKNNTTDHDHDQ